MFSYVGITLVVSLSSFLIHYYSTIEEYMVDNVAMHHIYKKDINTIVIIQQWKLMLQYILLYICLHIIYAITVSLSITIFICISSNTIHSYRMRYSIFLKLCSTVRVISMTGTAILRPIPECIWHHMELWKQWMLFYLGTTESIVLPYSFEVWTSSYLVLYQ